MTTFKIVTFLLLSFNLFAADLRYESSSSSSSTASNEHEWFHQLPADVKELLPRRLNANKGSSNARKFDLIRGFVDLTVVPSLDFSDEVSEITNENKLCLLHALFPTAKMTIVHKFPGPMQNNNFDVTPVSVHLNEQTIRVTNFEPISSENEIALFENVTLDGTQLPLKISITYANGDNILLGEITEQDLLNPLLNRQRIDVIELVRTFVLENPNELEMVLEEIYRAHPERKDILRQTHKLTPRSPKFKTEMTFQTRPIEY